MASIIADALPAIINALAGIGVFSILQTIFGGTTTTEQVSVDPLSSLISTMLSMQMMNQMMTMFSALTGSSQSGWTGILTQVLPIIIVVVLVVLFFKKFRG